MKLFFPKYFFCSTECIVLAEVFLLNTDWVMALLFVLHKLLC